MPADIPSFQILNLQAVPAPRSLPDSNTLLGRFALRLGPIVIGQCRLIRGSGGGHRVSLAPIGRNNRVAIIDRDFADILAHEALLHYLRLKAKHFWPPAVLPVATAPSDNDGDAILCRHFVN